MPLGLTAYEQTAAGECAHHGHLITATPPGFHPLIAHNALHEHAPMSGSCLAGTHFFIGHIALHRAHGEWLL